MINRNSYRSLIESVNESTSQGLIKEGPDWDSHAVRGSLKPKAAQRARANSSADVAMAAKSTAASVKPEAAISEEFDFVDAVLAEGLELYGEENLAIILEHFEQTGELSEELADLISNTLEEAATKQNAKPSREQSPVTARPGYRPMSDRIRNPLNLPKPPLPPSRPFYMDVDDDIPDNEDRYDIPSQGPLYNDRKSGKSSKAAAKAAKGKPGAAGAMGAAKGAMGSGAKASVDAASMG